MVKITPTNMKNDFFSEFSKIDAKYSARNHARGLENFINRKGDQF